MVNFDCYVVMPGCKHDIHVLATFTGLSYSSAYAANERHLSWPAQLRSHTGSVEKFMVAFQMPRRQLYRIHRGNEPSRGLANA
jgi:hypothetical protein